MPARKSRGRQLPKILRPKNKGKATYHTMDAIVNVRQKGSTRRIDNGIGLINQLKSICQKTVRALADPR